MSIRFMILIGLIMTIFNATSMTLTQHITVDGDGTMSSSSISPLARENLEATGKQELTRTLKQEDASSSLSSEYTLKSTPYKKLEYNGSFKVKVDQDSQEDMLSDGNVFRNLMPNRYQIGAINPYSLTHLIAVQGFDKIDLNNKVGYGKEISTNYNITADGTLSESVIDLKSGKTKSIEETSISGSDFSIQSSLTDEALITPASSLLDALNKVNMSGEKSVKSGQDPFATSSLNPQDFKPLVGITKSGSSIDNTPTTSENTQDINGNKVLRTMSAPASNLSAPTNNSKNGTSFKFDLTNITAMLGDGTITPVGEGPLVGKTKEPAISAPASNLSAPANNSKNGTSFKFDLTNINEMLGDGTNTPVGEGPLVGKTKEPEYKTNKSGNVLFVVDSTCLDGDNASCKNYLHIQSKFPTVNQLHSSEPVEFGLLRKPIEG
jgi:hypothetical protein